MLSVSKDLLFFFSVVKALNKATQEKFQFLCSLTMFNHQTKVQTYLHTMHLRATVYIRSKIKFVVDKVEKQYGRKKKKMLVTNIFSFFPLCFFKSQKRSFMIIVSLNSQVLSVYRVLTKEPDINFALFTSEISRATLFRMKG